VDQNACSVLDFKGIFVGRNTKVQTEKEEEPLDRPSMGCCLNALIAYKILLIIHGCCIYTGKLFKAEVVKVIFTHHYDIREAECIDNNSN
jgi:hypothetical protein